MRIIVCLLGCLIGATASAQTPLPRPHPALKLSGKVLPRPHPLRLPNASDRGMLRSARLAADVPLPRVRPAQPAPQVTPHVDAGAERSAAEQSALQIALAASPRPRPMQAPPHAAEPAALPPVPAALDLIVEDKPPPHVVAAVPLPTVRPAAAASSPQPSSSTPPVLDRIVSDEPQPLVVASVPLPQTRPPSVAPPPVEALAVANTPESIAPPIAAAPLPRNRPAEPVARPAVRFTLGALRKMYEDEFKEARERERFEPSDGSTDPAPASPIEPVELASLPAVEPATTPAAAPVPAEESITTTAAVLPAIETRVTPALPMPVILRIPTPRKRPNDALPRLFDAVFRELRVRSPGTECSALLSSGVVEADRLPGIGRGACHLADAVRINAIVMPDRRRVEFVPAATMRCSMAVEIINWIRGDVASAARVFSSPIVGIRNFDSYNCRSMSSSRRMLSEHGKGNALDINSLLLAGGQKVELTDRRVHRNFRDKLRLTACKRFKTVLGPGVPQHHDHIHVDLRKHFGPGGICHWNVH